MTEDEFYRDVGRLLRAHRRHSKMTQQAVATLLGFSRVSICNIERGVQKPSAYSLVRFGQIVGLQFKWSTLAGDRDE